MKFFKRWSNVTWVLLFSIAVPFSLFNLFYLAVNMGAVGEQIDQLVKSMPIPFVITYYKVWVLGIVAYTYILIRGMFFLNKEIKLLMNKFKLRNIDGQELNYTHLYKDIGNYVRLGGYQPIPSYTLINPSPPKSL